MRWQRWTTRLASIWTAHKRTEITIESDQVVIVRRQRSRKVWCRECGREVDAVSLSESEIFAGRPQPLVGEFAAIQGWHVFEDRDGSLLICLESVLRPR